MSRFKTTLATTSQRRQFLKQAAMFSAAAGVAASTQPLRAAAADKVQIGCIGVGGKGRSDMQETAAGNHIVAICDVDEKRLAKAAELFPKAARYTDWRKMLQQKDIHAVTISTPDHTHAPATLAALELGKHTYTQKPLARTVVEARQLATAAKKAGVVTQMGIQHHASDRLQTAVAAIHENLIGKVSEVHTWTDRPGTYWKQGMQRPTQKQTVPSHLHWDLWLGTAPQRPYVEGVYHPFHWRGWWDFGTGALGDMGCHILDPVVNALELGPPTMIRAEGPPPNPESGPTSCVVHYEFPGTRRTTSKLKLTWYEAGKQPPRSIIKAPDDWKGSLNGVLFVGQRGNLFVGFPEPAQLFPVADFANTPLPKTKSYNHYQEWTRAILGQTKTSCPLAYSGPLTETVLLGNVAYRSGQTIRWDSARLKASGAPQADPFIGHPGTRRRN